MLVEDAGVVDPVVVLVDLDEESPDLVDDAFGVLLSGVTY